MTTLNGFLQNHANGCDFYESGFTDYCTCGRFEARQEYKMLLARIAELEALTTWQPIESCPKNKDVLLLIMGEIAKGFYSPKIKQFEAEGCYYHDISCNLVTHWMPLPKPPEEK